MYIKICFAKIRPLSHGILFLCTFPIRITKHCKKFMFLGLSNSSGK